MRKTTLVIVALVILFIDTTAQQPVRRNYGNNPFPSISNLAIRVKASSLSLNDGDAVGTWSDLSGNGNDLTQGTPANKPVYKTTTGPDSQPFVLWNQAANHALSNAGISIDKRAFSVLWVGDLLGNDRTLRIWKVSGISVVLQHVNGFLQVFSSSGKTSTIKAPNQRRIAVIVTCGTSAVNVYLGRVANVSSLAANGAGSVSGFDMGDTATALYSRVYEAAVFTKELSTGEVDSLLRYSAAAYATGRPADTPIGRVVFDGDSITEGTGATNNQNWPYVLGVNASWLTYNFAIGGQKTTDIATDQSEVNTLAASGNWLFVYVGANDLNTADTGATIEGRINTYCSSARSAGFGKIVVFTVSATNRGAGNVARDDLNTLLRANYTSYADYLVDVAADSQLGVSGTSFNVPGNYVDGVHPNDTGVTLLVALIRSTIPSLPF